MYQYLILALPYYVPVPGIVLLFDLHDSSPFAASIYVQLRPCPFSNPVKSLRRPLRALATACFTKRSIDSDLTV
jgi:hypothetical protein